MPYTYKKMEIDKVCILELFFPISQDLILLAAFTWLLPTVSNRMPTQPAEETEGTMLLLVHILNVLLVE